MLGTRFATLLVLVVLVAPALSMLVPAGAQAPAASSGNLVIQDPVGDAGPFGFGAAPESPASAAYGHVDITRLEIGNDDIESFDIILDMVGFDDPTQAATQAVALTDFYCDIGWTYVHSDDDVRYSYTLTFGRGNLLAVPGSPPDQIGLEWRWSYWDGSDSNYDSSWGREWPGTLSYDQAESAFVIKMPKAWAPVWPGGHPPAAGDVLQASYASCRTDVLLYGSVSDYVEISEASRYAFQSAGQGSDLHVGFSAPEDGDVGANPLTWDPPSSDQFASQVSSVAPDDRTKVPVYISNGAESRKLIQLSVALEEPDAAGWNVNITPSIMVPADDLRKVNVIVTPPPGVALGTTTSIVVRAEATGEPSGAVAATMLRVTPVLDDTHNKFHLHTRYLGSSSPEDQVISEVGSPYALWASLLEVEPEYDNEPAVIGALGGLFTSRYFDPLVRPVRLDTAQPVQIAVGFEGAAGRTMNVEMLLLADDETIFAIDQNVPGNGVTQIEAILPGEGHLELDVGTELYFRMRVIPASTGPESAEDTSFLAKESHFILPVVPSGADYVLTDGRFLPSLALGKDEEVSTYLNPGKEYAFDLVLSNEGIETDDLRISVNATNATGWDVDIMPGQAFRVKPGNSTPIALVVKAPADAPEGQRALFDVIARSKHDARVWTQLRLDAIVTTNLDLEGKPYQAKDGQLAPLEEETGESSGLPLMAATLALAGLAVVARRRR